MANGSTETEPLASRNWFCIFGLRRQCKLYARTPTYACCWLLHSSSGPQVGQAKPEKLETAAKPESAADTADGGAAMLQWPAVTEYCH